MRTYYATDTDAAIARILVTARAFDRLSDDFFHAGNPLRGAQYHRLALETYRRAEALAEQLAEGR